MSLSDDQNLECPLCMEPFEMDDFTFFPCTCGYQICRFCWHRIRTDENGLCPACRKQYPEDPADFKPLSVEEFQKIKSEKRQKDQQRKHKVSESRKHLSDVRVVQKNLVFVVGLPARLADSDLLKKFDYFGKFGRIHKVVVNQSTSYAGSQGPSASAYVTYYRPEDALRAIKTVNNIQIDGRTLKASLGTTKYCSHFLKNQQCPKMDCMYLHELGDEAASFTKDDMKQGGEYKVPVRNLCKSLVTSQDIVRHHSKHQEYERRLQEQHQVAVNTKEAVSPTPQKKPHSCKETWPSASQNSKAARAKESKTEKQNRSKSKHACLDSQKNKKIKGKSEELNHSNSSVKNCKNREESLDQKRGPKGQKISKDSVISSPSPLQRTEEASAFRNNMDVDKQSAVNEMNNKNMQKTLVHIGEQPVCNQSMKSSTKARCDSPSFPSSPTSSSSSSLFTPYGSLSSNFLSSSPSPPPHNADHASYSTEDCSQNEEDGNYSTNDSPQNFLETAPGRPQCVTFSSSKTNALCSQLNVLSISPDCSNYGSPTADGVTLTSEPETNPLYGHAFTPQTQQHDDDLDFDPWDESSKGLADLIAKETVHKTFSTTSIPPGFSHLVQSNVPNQRIPPGFMCKKQTGNLASTFMPTKEKIQPMRNETAHIFQDLPQNHGLFSKHVPMQNVQDINSRVNEVYKTKNLQEGFRALFPNINVTFSGCGPQRSYSPSGPPLNSACGEGPWLPHETSAILPGGTSDGPLWQKTVQVEEDSNRFLNTYSSLFALRGQWPSSSQCPPPGFVAPSRPPANTPYQHAQINRSELKSKPDSIG